MGKEHANETVDSLRIRFEKNLIEDKRSGCWNWTGSNSNGYGYFRVTAFAGFKNAISAHRVSRLIYCGDSIETTNRGTHLEWDHLCRNTKCVNPWHLDLVSIRENNLRSNGAAAISHRRTHCPRGHKLSGKNLIKHLALKGLRECRICKNASERRRYLEKTNART